MTGLRRAELAEDMVNMDLRLFGMRSLDEKGGLRSHMSGGSGGGGVSSDLMRLLANNMVGGAAAACCCCCLSELRAARTTFW